MRPSSILQAQSNARAFKAMPKSKSPRKNKKYRPTTGRIPVGLMHKLEVPESRIQALKQKHDAALLRMYMGSDDWQDRCELYSVLRFGESLCEHVENGEAIATRLREAMHLLAKEPEVTENGQRNLDLVREALDRQRERVTHVARIGVPPGPTTVVGGLPCAKVIQAATSKFAFTCSRSFPCNPNQLTFPDLPSC